MLFWKQLRLAALGLQAKEVPPQAAQWANEFQTQDATRTFDNIWDQQARVSLVCCCFTVMVWGLRFRIWGLVAFCGSSWLSGKPCVLLC